MRILLHFAPHKELNRGKLQMFHPICPFQKVLILFGNSLYIKTGVHRPLFLELNVRILICTALESDFWGLEQKIALSAAGGMTSFTLHSVRSADRALILFLFIKQGRIKNSQGTHLVILQGSVYFLCSQTMADKPATKSPK